jgi:glycosyltransferase involved in cell wall biosynthesis
MVIDATAAVRQQAGVGRFARGVLAGLAATDRQNHYSLVTTGRARITLAPDAVPDRSRWLRLPISERVARIAWHRLRLLPSPALLVPRADLYFTPDFALPPTAGVPSILTIHDLSFLVNPECAADGLRRYLEREVPRSIRNAAAVAVVSRTTADAVRHLLGVEDQRIAVIPNGVDPQFCPLTAAPGDAPPVPPFGLPPGYLLAVGTLEPRKNYPRLLQAFALWRERWARERHQPGASGASGDRSPMLVIVGREGWKYEPIFREHARLSLGENVRFFGQAGDNDLLALYQHAGGFVFPSLYEGFGLPPLEAMACGIPVAASTGGSLPEVLGQAALYFDPLDVEGMAEALLRLHDDHDLRRSLCASGLAQAALWTWQGSAARALDLFRQVAS